jgi:hypothetical protein
MGNVIYNLLRDGPCPYFYCGKGNQEICAEMTRVASSHWDDHEEECEGLVNRSLRSQYAVMNFVLAFYCGMKLCNLACELLLTSFRVRVSKLNRAHENQVVS